MIGVGPGTGVNSRWVKRLLWNMAYNLVSSSDMLPFEIDSGFEKGPSFWEDYDAGSSRSNGRDCPTGGEENDKVT